MYPNGKRSKCTLHDVLLVPDLALVYPEQLKLESQLSLQSLDVSSEKKREINLSHKDTKKGVFTTLINRESQFRLMQSPLEHGTVVFDTLEYRASCN